MSPKPQQQRTTHSGRTAGSRSGTGAGPRTGTGTGSRTGTDEFERLLRANTVEVGRNGVVARRGAAPRRRGPLLGKLALALAIASVAVDASAFAVFMGGDGRFALGICFVVVFLTFVAAVLGFIAAVGGFGRWYGVGGVLIGFVANPVVLIVVLVFVAPDMATQFGA